MAFVNQLEFSRVRAHGHFSEVIRLEEAQAEAMRQFPGYSPLVALVASFKNAYQVDGFRVAGDFPAGLYQSLQDAGVPIRASMGPVVPERVFKDDDAAAQIRRGNQCSEAGFAYVQKVLADSSIVEGALVYQGKPLTSEFLQREIAKSCLDRGAIAAHTIVAGGNQACDPHCEGSGALKANELIIVDIFPRLADTGYHGDMTRTFLKGQASADQRALVQVVRETQQFALDILKAGIDGFEVWLGVMERMTAAGFSTRMTASGAVGFFHGLGHGLGLEVHEAPRLSRVHEHLQSGQVVTVEPGLYYPGLGGCRIEDVVRICDEGCELLSAYPYDWEIG